MNKIKTFLPAVLGAALLLTGCGMSGASTEDYVVKSFDAPEKAGYTEAFVGVEDVLEPVYWSGEYVRDAFMRAYVDYAIAAGSINGIGAGVKLSTAEDLISQTYNAGYLGGLYEEILSALLLQSGVTPQPPKQSISLMDVFSDGYSSQYIGNLSLQAGGQGGTLYSGSTDIAVFYNDIADRERETVRGYAYSLLSDGIPVRFVCASDIDENEIPDDVSVIIVAGENTMLTLEPVRNKLVKWTENGGVLVYLGGLTYNENKTAELFLDAMGCGAKIGSLELERDMSPVQSDSAGAEKTEKLTVSTRYSEKICVYEPSSPENTFITLNDSPVGICESVGAGRFIAVGIHSDVLRASKMSSEFVRGIAAYALSAAGREYCSSDVIRAERGNYEIVRTFGEEYTLDGSYLTLTGESGKFVTNPTVGENSSAVYYRIDADELEKGSGARVLYSTCNYTEDQQSGLIGLETASETETVILRSPDGMIPDSVNADSSSGEVYYTAKWDAETGLLTVTVIPQDKNEPRLSVEWKKDDGSGSRSYSTYEKKVMTVQTNNKNEDASFLYYNTAYVHDTLRFADGATEIVYRFNMNDYPLGTVTLYVVQNYIIEISPDYLNWTMIADYSQGGTVPHTKSGGNNAEIKVTPEMYGDWDEVYVRIRNSDTSQGWGGSISSFSITYLGKTK